MKWILIFFVSLLTLLLFVGSPDNYDSRIIKQIWESGHFALFASLVFVLVQTTRLQKLPLLLLVLIVTIFSVCFGLITELIQLLVGRSFELKDIINDLIGAYAGLLTAQLSRRNTVITNLLILTGILFFTLIGLRSLIIASIDQWHTEKSFPILSDFETNFQVGRWDFQHAELSNSKEQKRSGMHSMKVDFFPGKYPDITLQHFKRDWRNYNRISFSLYNTTGSPIEFNLKIYDTTHPFNGYSFDDRFNHELILQPGWNDYKYSLSKIKHAPIDRNMEMRSILSFSLFAIDLNKATTVFIDDVKLSQE